MTQVYASVLRTARDFVDLERSHLEADMRYAASFARGALVDIGCGDKPYEAIFAPRVTRYVGVEFADSFLESDSAAKSRADIIYSGGVLPFVDSEFDTVLCNQVVEHVPSPEPFFSELVRVLRPGGRLILTVPFSHREHAQPFDFHRFTRFALARLAERNALTIEVLRPRGGFWSVIGQKLASHLALRYARLGADVQKLGGLGHERPLEARPRYWTLPAVAPAIFGIAAVARVLDRFDRVDSDTLGYLLIATKRDSRAHE